MTICIVGAGVAGMMAAISAREQNQNSTIIVVEKNAILGRKVIISGGGFAYHAVTHLPGVVFCR